jgi:hypothetical protein
MSFQFGEAPRKQLSEEDRCAIAALLKKDTAQLAEFFGSLEQIITSHSLEARPLVEPIRRDTIRAELAQLRMHADALQATLGKADEQIIMRLALGSLMSGPNGEPPLGDFSQHLLRFRNQLQAIDEALTPPRGDRARVDHLRSIVYLCAVEYQRATGEIPAKRTRGVFHQMLVIVLRTIGLELPDHPYNVLSPAIDAASPLWNKGAREPS